MGELTPYLSISPTGNTETPRVCRISCAVAAVGAATIELLCHLQYPGVVGVVVVCEVDHAPRLGPVPDPVQGGPAVVHPPPYHLAHQLRRPHCSQLGVRLKI